MGWSYAVLEDGREVGYGVEATCEHPGCEAQIDRGLAYACGGLDAVIGRSEIGCGHHFCYEHLFLGGPAQMCPACSDAWHAEGGREVEP